MGATFTDEQRQIEKTILAISADGLERARACLENGWQPPPFDVQLYEGFGGLGLAMDVGGVGSDLVDLLVAVEALARRLTPTGFTAHAAAVQLAASAGIDVGDAVAGRVRWTPAVDEPGSDGPFVSQARGDDTDRVRVDKTLVANAEGVDAIVATTADRVVLLPARNVRQRPTIDSSRPFSDAFLDDVPIASGALGDGLLRGCLVAAADLCGAGTGALAIAAQHARTREQFGVRIGSFQGVAFQLVDAFVGLKAAWDLTLYAAWAIEQGAPDAVAHVHAAKAKAGQAALFAAERTIQVHGGMGITWEADPHLYLRRALATDVWFGTGRWHRRELGRLRLRAG